MAGYGPIPKRDEARIRRNEPEVPTEKVTAIGLVPVPELDLDGYMHPMVEEYYQAMIDSAQSRYFEPTDWQQARFTLLVMNEMLTATNENGDRKPIPAMKLQVLNQMLSSLLVTEGDRRRVRMEIERANGQAGEGQVVQMSDYFKQQFAK